MGIDLLRYLPYYTFVERPWDRGRTHKCPILRIEKQKELK